MERVANRRFGPSPQPTRAVEAEIPSIKGNLGATAWKVTQCVATSQQPYPTADREALLDDLKGVVPPSSYLSHSFEQVSVPVVAFYLVANFPLAALGPHRNRKREAQKQWWALFNLLEEHQPVPYFLGRGREGLSRDD